MHMSKYVIETEEIPAKIKIVISDIAKLNELSHELPPPSPYSPDLTPQELFLFPK